MAQTSHAWVVASPSPEERQRQAAMLAAAIVCQQHNGTACGRCRDCRKALEGIHPDVIRIKRENGKDGKLRQNIIVDQVRAVCKDACVLPNEAQHKVYLFTEADKLNLEAQNALLKLLEEPPEHAALILCVGNQESLLPTVRSRCTVRQYSGQEAAFSDEACTGAQQLLEAVAAGNRANLFACCVELADCKTPQALELIQCAGCRCAQMLCGQRDTMGMSEQRLMSLHKLFEVSTNRLRVNANVKNLFGMIAVTALK